MKQVLLKTAAIVMLLGILLVPALAEETPEKVWDGEMEFTYKGETYQVTFINVGIRSDGLFFVCLRCDSWPKEESILEVSAYDAEGQKYRYMGHSIGNEPERKFTFSEWNQLPETVYVTSSVNTSKRYLVWRNPGTPEILTDIWTPDPEESTEAVVTHYKKEYHVTLHAIGFGEKGELCVAMACPDTWNTDRRQDGDRAWVSVLIDGEEIPASRRGSDPGAEEQIFHFDGCNKMPDAVYVRSTDSAEKNKRVLVWQNNVDYVPGMRRIAQYNGYNTAQVLAERYGISLSDGIPLYTPAHPAPLNAYMAVHEACMVGINKDGMYPVSEKGLVPQITRYLNIWINDIQKQSDGLIRFVENPDYADILVCAELSYSHYSTYTGPTGHVEGYSCIVNLTAVQLTNPANRCQVSRSKKPADSVSVSLEASRFWEDPPDFTGTAELRQLVYTIKTWYGFSRDERSGVKYAQEVLADRGYLKGKADGIYNAATEEAVKKLQAEYGLPENGELDDITLQYLYYTPGEQ